MNLLYLVILYNEPPPSYNEFIHDNNDVIHVKRVKPEPDFFLLCNIIK